MLSSRAVLFEVMCFYTFRPSGVRNRCVHDTNAQNIERPDRFEDVSAETFRVPRVPPNRLYTYFVRGKEKIKKEADRD